MNNIIKHINYSEFVEILGIESLKQFVTNTKGHSLIFFIAEWSVPSRLTYKRIRKIGCNKKKIGFVDVDLVDNIELCEIYKVTKIPHCIVFCEQKIDLEFVGLDIEKLNEALLKFNLFEQEEGHKEPENCPNGHKMQKMKQMPYPPYMDNFVYCNKCKKIEKCGENNQVLHCGECDYDMCKYCQLTS